MVTAKSLYVNFSLGVPVDGSLEVREYDLATC